MKWFFGLAIIFVLFAGTSLSIRINAPGRHFHRRSAATNQGFLHAHKRFTETLSHVAATIQEAREGLSETKQTETHQERSDSIPQNEEVETIKEVLEVVEDTEKEGNCLHPKDINCKPNEKESASKMTDDQSEVESRNLDFKVQEIYKNESDTKVKVENDANTENITETQLEVNIETQIDNSTGVEKGTNGTDMAAGNGTKIESGNSTGVENATEIDAANSTLVENGYGTQSKLANLTLTGNENHTETVMDQENATSEAIHENVDTSKERSDDIVLNEIIIDDEEEVKHEPTQTQVSNSSSIFAKFFKLIKDNSQVILGL